MSDVHIRKMIDTDVPAAMRVLSEWNMAPREATDHAPDPERSGLDIERSFVAEHGGRLVGTASWIDHGNGLGETASLAVDPAVKGQGVGHRLQVARMEEMVARRIHTLRTETDRPATIRWYVNRFGYRVVGTNPKKHAFSLPDVNEWTVLELDLTAWAAAQRTT